jgi:hypothetical protein
VAGLLRLQESFPIPVLLFNSVVTLREQASTLGLLTALHTTR